MFFNWLFLGITIFFVILVFLFINKFNNSTKKVNLKQNKAIENTIQQPLFENKNDVNVEKKYQVDILNLENFINSEDKINLILKKVEDNFLQIRVPKNEQDKYLKVFLKYFSEKETLQQSDINIAKQKLLDLLSELKQKN